MIDGILLLGFGGPTPGCCGRRAVCPRTPGCEAACFVSGVLGDNPARAGRVEAVAAHYAHFGGYSPYNRLTMAQGERLAAVLAERGLTVPVACGFRHWQPWASDGLQQLSAAGCKRVLLVVMAPHQSSVSWDWYLKHAAEAAESLGSSAPELVGVADPFFTHPGFIAASVARLREATATWTPQRRLAARLIFTAHAVPEPVARTSQYTHQVAESARLVAAAYGQSEHLVAYQSAPPPGGVAWTGPDILTLVDQAAKDGVTDILVQAVGFLVDHTEVTYDLDIEAGQHAQALGLHLTRAGCVQDHPAFIAALADQIQRAAARIPA